MTWGAKINILALGLAIGSIALNVYVAHLQCLLAERIARSRSTASQTTRGTLFELQDDGSTKITELPDANEWWRRHAAGADR